MKVNRKLLVSFLGSFKDKQIIPLNKLDGIHRLHLLRNLYNLLSQN